MMRHLLVRTDQKKKKEKGIGRKREKKLSQFLRGIIWRVNGTDEFVIYSDLNPRPVAHSRSIWEILH